MSETTTANEVSWNSILEKYFTDTGEKAQAFNWLHKRSEEYFSHRVIPIDIIVIVLGTLNGATSVGSKTLFGDTMFASVVIGVIALICSILNTVNSYFSWSKRCEGHRVASLHYGKLYRFLSVEMSLPRDERIQPKDLLKYTKDQYDRLQEISPLIPPTILNMFRAKFGKQHEIALPEETNGLHKIQVYRDVNIISPTQQSDHFKISITE
jgi:hypothetical protein